MMFWKNWLVTDGNSSDQFSIAKAILINSYLLLHSKTNSWPLGPRPRWVNTVSSPIFQRRNSRKSHCASQVISALMYYLLFSQAQFTSQMFPFRDERAPSCASLGTPVTHTQGSSRGWSLLRHGQHKRHNMGFPAEWMDTKKRIFLFLS